MNTEKTIMITGGAGFIGSHTVRLFVKKYPQYRIVNVDALTYAGNLKNLTDIESESNYTFIKADITDAGEMNQIFDRENITDVIHLAAESHVDRSITDPGAFVRTNVTGTVNVLNAALHHWKKDDLKNHLFYHVSTDEVYGSLGSDGYFTEETPYDPRSPYSASKASSDHFVRAWQNTYGLRTLISNCSNNYGPYQFPEKLIPLMLNNIKNLKSLPVYGKGENIRDWLYVEDHAKAIDMLFHRGKSGETYNIGGHNEWKNIDVVYLLCELVDQKLGREPGTSKKLITFVKDRAGHDMRYAIDASKIERQPGWTPDHDFKTGMDKTVSWYLENEEWLKEVTSGAYREYYEERYENR